MSSNLEDLPRTTTPGTGDLLYLVANPDTAPASFGVTVATVLALVPPAAASVSPATCEGRLTTESGVAVSTADRTAQSTLYFTPFRGSRVSLYDGAAWVSHSLTERSLALSGLTSGKPYDVFLQNVAGTLTLVLLVWTNDTTRATALAVQDGILVKTGDATQRYLGTIYTSGATTIEDTQAKRWCWNYYHRVRRTMKGATETANTWTYTTATFRQANANVANQLDYVVGVNEDAVEAEVYALVQTSGANVSVTTGIGVDSTSVNSALGFGYSVPAAGTVVMGRATYRGTPGVGRHFLAWLEYSAASGTTTWCGDVNLPTQFQSFIGGTLFG